MVISDKLPWKKLCADLIETTKSRKDIPNFNILLKPFSLNLPYQRVYIMYNKAMTIANLVDIFCTTEYNHS